MEEHKPERQAGGCLTKVTAANAEAVLFALQVGVRTLCAGCGDLWRACTKGNSCLCQGSAVCTSGGRARAVHRV